MTNVSSTCVGELHLVNFAMLALPVGTDTCCRLIYPFSYNKTGKIADDVYTIDAAGETRDEKLAISFPLPSVAVQPRLFDS